MKVAENIACALTMAASITSIMGWAFTDPHVMGLSNVLWPFACAATWTSKTKRYGGAE